MPRALRVISFLGLVVLCTAIWLTWSMQRLIVNPEPFDVAQWKEMEAAGHVSNDPGCYRGAMAVGVIESQELVGKASAELAALLGQPESTMGNHWFYPVGQCSGDMVHSALVLTFGKDGVVVNAKLKRES